MTFRIGWPAPCSGNRAVRRGTSTTRSYISRRPASACFKGIEYLGMAFEPAAADLHPRTIVEIAPFDPGEVLGECWRLVPKKHKLSDHCMKILMFCTVCNDWLESAPPCSQYKGLTLQSWPPDSGPYVLRIFRCVARAATRPSFSHIERLIAHRQRLQREHLAARLLGLDTIEKNHVGRSVMIRVVKFSGITAHACTAFNEASGRRRRHLH